MGDSLFWQPATLSFFVARCITVFVLVCGKQSSLSLSLCVCVCVCVSPHIQTAQYTRSKVHELRLLIGLSYIRIEALDID